VNASPPAQEQPTLGNLTKVIPKISDGLDFKIISVPIGYILKGRFLLSTEGGHTDQRRNVCFLEQILVSVIFGKDDTFSGSKRIFEIKKKADIIKFLKTLYFGSEIRVILDIDDCPCTLDILNTVIKKKVRWLNGRVASLTSTTKKEKDEKKTIHLFGCNVFVLF